MADDPLINETELRQRISWGDEAAFYTLYNHYRPLLRHFALNLTKSDADAEDILQETFIRVWLFRDRIEEVENMRAWIFTVSARVCYEFLRRQLNYRKKIESFSHLPGTKPEQPTPYDAFKLGEVSALIKEVVEAMPAKRRQIFQMSRDENLKPSEIASHLSLSVGTVKNVLTMALKEIRERLKASGHLIVVFLHIFF